MQSSADALREEVQQACFACTHQRVEFKTGREFKSSRHIKPETLTWSIISELHVTFKVIFCLVLS